MASHPVRVYGKKPMCKKHGEVLADLHGIPTCSQCMLEQARANYDITRDRDIWGGDL